MYRASAFISSNFSEDELIDKASLILSKALDAASDVFCSNSFPEQLIYSVTFCKENHTISHQQSYINL